MSERIRLTITVTPEVHALFKRMSEVSGLSIGRCMGDWLEDTAESAQLMTQKLEQVRLSPAMAQHMFTFSQVEQIQKLVENPPVRRRPGNPPSSNTGGKSSKTPPSTPSKKSSGGRK